MNKLIIRNLSIEDVNDVAKIKIESWKKTYKGIVDDSYLNSLSLSNQISKFKECVGSTNFIVAILNGKVVGFCRFVYDNSFSQDIGYVDSELTALYVHPDMEGQGVGKGLFSYVIDSFYKNNKETMILWCLEDNVNSIKFYKHMGGKIKEKKQVMIGDKEYGEVGIVYNIKKQIMQ